MTFKVWFRRHWFTSQLSTTFWNLEECEKKCELSLNYLDNSLSWDYSDNSLSSKYGTFWTFWFQTFILAADAWCGHCLKTVQIRSYFWSVFSCIWTRNNSVFGLSSSSKLRGKFKDCLWKLVWCISRVSNWLGCCCKICLPVVSS